MSTQFNGQNALWINRNSSRSKLMRMVTHANLRNLWIEWYMSVTKHSDASTRHCRMKVINKWMEQVCYIMHKLSNIWNKPNNTTSAHFTLCHLLTNHYSIHRLKEITLEVLLWPDVLKNWLFCGICTAKRVMRWWDKCVIHKTYRWWIGTLGGSSQKNK